MKKVTVYSTPTCPYCVNLKKYLDEKGIPYEDVNIAENKDKKEEVFGKSGHRVVPITYIGEDFVVGYDIEEINKLLEL